MWNASPGQPKTSSEIGVDRRSGSHHNNGIIGEVFNAILVSLSFVEKDVKDILEKTILMIPRTLNIIKLLILPIKLA